MNKTWLFNPFKYIAGLKSLAIGWAIMLATAGIAYSSKAHFDGVIDVHGSQALPFYRYILEQLIAWASAVLLFYIAGLIFSGLSVRFVDVAGTMALARWPMFLVAVIHFAMPPIIDIHHIPVSSAIVTLIELPLVVWMVALMYHAFSVSCNLKGGKATVIFITALLAAEALSKFGIYLLQLHIH